MKELALIFPHQLYQQHPALHPNRPVVLMEETLFFNQYRFHKQKLVLHRASMKAMQQSLVRDGHSVLYMEAREPLSDIRRAVAQWALEGLQHIHYCECSDYWLEKRLKTAAAKAGILLVQYPNPNFLNQPAALNEYFKNRKTYFQTDFYIAQRKKQGWLLQKDGKPLGGKWSFDAENRKKMPATQAIPRIQQSTASAYTKEAIQYVEQFFPEHYGFAVPFIYPVSHPAAEEWLKDFLRNRFENFGNYEDAMVREETFLFHSVLTPMLNIGLLNPQQIISESLKVAETNNIPLNATEGFLRQITGWREFIRAVYLREGSQQRTRNYWGFKRKIPAAFWTGDTGIEPVDTVIRRVLRTGYSHHIERLMVLGNFMLLCEFDPDEVYRWFMEMYIDSYDWVMVPNVYGMTQFADGGLMTTKPYISGSNYLMKMGNWKKGPWQEVWDGLFWRFMHVHRDFFLSNPRLGMLVKTFDKMSEEKRKMHLQNAERFLQKLDQ